MGLDGPEWASADQRTVGSPRGMLLSTSTRTTVRPRVPGDSPNNQLHCRASRAAMVTCKNARDRRTRAER